MLPSSSQRARSPSYTCECRAETGWQRISRASIRDDSGILGPIHRRQYAARLVPRQVEDSHIDQEYKSACSQWGRLWNKIILLQETGSNLYSSAYDRCFCWAIGVLKIDSRTVTDECTRSQIGQFFATND